MKIFILKNNKEHFWYSVNIIQNSLYEAMKASRYETEDIEIDGEVLSLDQIERIHEESKKQKCFVYFLSDHLLQEEICHQLHGIENLTYLIQIYGNVTIELYRYLDFDKTLRGKQVAFLCASDRSVDQVKLLMKDTTVKKLVYPIHIKKEPIIDNNDGKIRIIYSGRITPQKNIFPLIETFLKASKLRDDLELHIAGSFHDRVYHFHGINFDFEKYKENFYDVISKNECKIFFHEFLKQEELIKLYGEMDIFCSMSTFHDEDYGVSAAQAGLMGLPLLLSDWGGHASFPEARFIPVYVDERNIPLIDKKKLFLEMMGLVKEKNKKISQNLENYLSFVTFDKSLCEIIENKIKPYGGISPLYELYCEKGLKFFPFSPINNKIADSKKLYMDIYKSYLGIS